MELENILESYMADLHRNLAKIYDPECFQVMDHE